MEKGWGTIAAQVPDVYFCLKDRDRAPPVSCREIVLRADTQAHKTRRCAVPDFDVRQDETRCNWQPVWQAVYTSNPHL